MSKCKFCRKKCCCCVPQNTVPKFKVGDRVKTRGEFVVVAAWPNGTDSVHYALVMSEGHSESDMWKCG